MYKHCAIRKKCAHELWLFKDNHHSCTIVLIQFVNVKTYLLHLHMLLFLSHLVLKLLVNFKKTRVFAFGTKILPFQRRAAVKHEYNTLEKEIP